MASGDRFDASKRRLSRRAFMSSLPVAMAAPAAFAQADGIRLERLNSFEIRVSDTAAALDF
ncbi:MAG TPA: hypothetical protein VIV64_00335, partial [Gammaproteobacteria bacterium]